ncbi:MAG: hypothetical protein JJU11_00770 [Candidatus Sumerlaeia bacterium]|nr:hypothetical protein [Candidatus Sumerlaeia bacterium]
MMASPSNQPVIQEEENVHVGDPDSRGRAITPWAWVPTVNFAQGLQYAVVIQLILLVFFTMGLPLGITLFWVGLLQLPWTLKPLWSPLVDRYWTKRSWTIWMQGLVALCFVGIGFSLLVPGQINVFGNELPTFFFFSLIFLFLMAFAAATHDIACDGFYMLGLSEKKQAFYVGVRSTAFRAALIFATGILLWFAGIVQKHTGLEPQVAEVRVVVTDEGVPPMEEQMTGFQGPGSEQAVIFDPPIVLAAPDQATTLTVRLAQPPEQGRELVVILAHDDGDPGITINREDTRMVFTSENWSTGQTARISVDHRIREETSTSFRATSGNIPFSWMVVMLLCAGMFATFFFYHQFSMPVPSADVIFTEHKPMILIPIFWLLVTVGTPLLFFFLSFRIMGMAAPFFQEMFYPNGTMTDLDEKGFNFFFSAARYIILILVGAALVKAPGISQLLLSMFRTTSRLSQIGFASVFETFFMKKGMAITLGFLLTFRLGEAQLAQVKNPFLIDAAANGGVAMTLSQLAFSNTFVYLLMLTIGGLLGGFIIAGYGLKKVIWYMVAAMHLPNLLYIWIAVADFDPMLTSDLFWINVVIGIESFGYGFGFAAYLMIMIMSAAGPYKTAHYALCTGFMALGFMIPGMWSGYLAELVGYPTFFGLVMLFTIPGILFIPFLSIDPTFGMKKKAANEEASEQPAK